MDKEALDEEPLENDEYLPRATLQEMHQQEIRSIFHHVEQTLSKAYKRNNPRRQAELMYEQARFERHRIGGGQKQQR